MAYKSSVPKMGKPTPIQVPAAPPGMTPKKLKVKMTFKGKGMSK